MLPSFSGCWMAWLLLSFSSSQHPFVWLLKAPQLSGAMLLFDCFLSPQLLLVKILAVALVGTFRELLIGSQEQRLARAETLRNDGGRNWCFGCLVCNVESFSTAQLRSRDEILRYYRPNKKNLSQKWHSSTIFLITGLDCKNSLHYPRNLELGIWDMESPKAKIIVGPGNITFANFCKIWPKWCYQGQLLFWMDPLS